MTTPQTRSQTSLLGLPFLFPHQSLKHVTHNEALERLDKIVNIVVEMRDVADINAVPNDIHRVCLSDTSVDYANALAVKEDDIWHYVTPHEGWTAYDLDANETILFDGQSWRPANDIPDVLRVLELGVGTDPDSINGFAVAAPASLLTARTDDHRLTINKSHSNATASMVLQSGFTGQAELGLIGDDDFALKVFDGTIWNTALQIDRQSGAVSLPLTAMREGLTGPHTYHVSPTGDDANDGLSTATAKQSVQAAIDAALTIDAMGHSVTIQLAAGTYNEAVTVHRPMFDGGTLIVRGNNSQPDSVILNGGAATALLLQGSNIRLQLEGLTLSGSIGLWVRHNSVAFLRGHMIFQNCPNRGISVDNGAYVECIGTFDFSGNSSACLFASAGGHILMSQSTLNIINTPHYSAAFLHVRTLGLATLSNLTVSGSATGPSYQSLTGGIISASQSDLDALPGS